MFYTHIYYHTLKCYIKKKKVLISHPDKGGDAAIFREVQTSFEILRNMYTNKTIKSFSTFVSPDNNYDKMWKDFGEMPIPSWEYFYSAAEEELPAYRIELAKSGRSKCNQMGKAKKCMDDTHIAKDDIRIGILDPEHGGYHRWVHLNCWRIPSKVWLGLPDPDTCSQYSQFESALIGMNEVLLSWFGDLPLEDKKRVVDYAMDKQNFARLVNRHSGDSSGPVKKESK